MIARFAVTIFLSAFLLFQVEPIIARFIVPWFGGSAAVWTTCLLFFQIVLLAGYLYSHAVISKLSTGAQRTTHLALLGVSALAVLVLHITPWAAWKPNGTEEPTGRILLLLFLTVGLPYFTLSTTGPLLQAWYAQAAAAAGQTTVYPYRLYSLSNLGSMLALLSYPIIVEPLLPLHIQAWVWSVGFLVFAGFCGAIAASLKPGIPAAATPDALDVAPAKPISAGNYLVWLVLSATTSVMLLAVTNHVTQNVAAVPFLWVLPLSLYLLSFIVCFGGKEWRWKRSFAPLPALALLAMTYALADGNENLNVNLLLPLWMGGLFVSCLLCHGELARLKPAPSQLTAFYLMMSIGGALGGVFVGLIAPHIFNAFYELPLSVGAVGVIALFVLYFDREERGIHFSSVTTCALTTMLLCYLYQEAHGNLRFFRVSARNFYGVLQVRDVDTDTPDTAIRSLNNGTILHGNQFLAPAKKRLPTTYYGPKSGIGRAIQVARAGGKPVRVGVIGLGTGTIAAWGHKGDMFTFFDINPQVVTLARTEFSYLTDCPATTDVLLGDARLSLERGEGAAAGPFDVLAVDAFSSDSIPVHLLTREAFAAYFRRLSPDGILCVHVSNRHVDLQPVVGAAADNAGKTALLVDDSDDSDTGVSASEWILVSARPHLADQKALRGATAPPRRLAGFHGWTDDFVNLWTLLKKRG